MTRDWDERADQLSVEALAAGTPTAWFDRLYAEGRAGTVGMPWDRTAVNVPLAAWYESWAAGRTHHRAPGRAVVVGCGLGADAEFLAERGWTVTAFDVAPTAVAEARDRHPGTAVDYRVADLLDLPVELRGAYDLVVEVFTLQALPASVRPAAAASVASLAAPGGTICAVAFRDVSGAPLPDHPPFPLTYDDLAAVAVDGVELVRATPAPAERWVAEYVRR